MVVQDKQADIAILRTLGATPRSIMAIFMVQGSIIGIVGTALGVLGGVCLALNIETLVPILEQLTHHQFLAPDVYYISDLPSQLRSEEHTSELQSLMRISYAVFCLKKKKKLRNHKHKRRNTRQITITHRY